MRLTEKTLQRILIAGTAVSLVALAGMSADSLARVKAGRTPELTAAVARGKQVWNRRNCNDCHTVLGIGGYYAPDVTKVLDRRDTTWLLRWFADPRLTKPGTTMPPQQLPAQDANDVVAFLTWVHGIDTNGWPPTTRTGAAAGGSEAAAGALLFDQKGCSACHVVNGRGAQGVGPDLSHLASVPWDGLSNSPEFLDRWIENPAAQKPGTLMPALGLSPAERGAMVRYLETLR